jgi:hypothetical protein
MDGILGHSLLLSRAFLVGIPSWVGFEATTCCLLPFRWESLSGWDFLGHNLSLSQASFFTMEFRLSQSLSHEPSFFFHDGILAITKPFSRTLFFFHDGILAITKPSSRTHFFFHDGILAITKPFSRTLFFFHDGILAITKPFSRTFFFFHDGILAITKPFSRTLFFFHDGILKNTRFGGRLFLYISHRVFT